MSNNSEQLTSQSIEQRLLDNVKNPLVNRLTALGVIFFRAGDVPATVVIFMMVLLGIVLGFFRELRADNAANSTIPRVRMAV